MDPIEGGVFPNARAQYDVDVIAEIVLGGLRGRLRPPRRLDVADDVRLGRKVVRNDQERGQDPAITLRNYLNSGRNGCHQVLVHDSSIAQLRWTLVRGSGSAAPS
jgi:hypothetical protein